MSNAEATERVHRALDEGKKPAREDLLAADTGALLRWLLLARALNDSFVGEPLPACVAPAQQARTLVAAAKHTEVRTLVREVFK